jgi:hypothetical protein
MKNIKYHLPVIGKIIKDRDALLVERDSLLAKFPIKKIFSKPVDFKKLSRKYSHSLTGLETYLSGKKNIFDVGTGPIGSPWWQKTDQNSTINGVDLYFFPKSVPKNVNIYKFDASKLNLIKSADSLEKYLSENKFKKEKINWYGKHDLVVANHVLEHVVDPEKLILGISHLIKKNGIVYTGFPDYRNFTDTFYHLVHPDGGGHIQQLTNAIVQKMFEKHGFKLVKCNIWPDDWLWFQSCYKPENFGIKHINQSQINYLCDVFRRELTPQKGFFYGWEMIFKKL